MSAKVDSESAKGRNEAASRHEKLLERVLSGEADANVRFEDLCRLLQRLGFTMEIRGSHHVFRKPNSGIINLQPAGQNAKSYQVRQVRKVLQGNPE